MTYSMTAFARSDTPTPWGELNWELRSVNHRYLEVSLRLPDELRTFEPAFRERISASVKRGRIDGLLRFNPKETIAEDADIDDAAARRLIQLARRVEAMLPNAQSLRTVDVLRWPGVLSRAEIDAESLADSAAALLQTTLDALVDMRRREGTRLEGIIRERLTDIGAIVDEVDIVVPEVVTQFRQRLEERLAEIREQLDPDRMEQEVVLFAQKSDVREEIDRLRVHVDEVARVFDRKDPIGRRLDFLMQELNRETNTLGSKSVDVRLRNASVELKVLIEQMREQIQNIE